ncbi:MAG: hypothetical protein OK454_07750 [Thaumarchaeota archaeon]|nr:hypothetical protein [Nitrososphaerota archaeon]
MIWKGPRDGFGAKDIMGCMEVLQSSSRMAIGGSGTMVSVKDSSPFKTSREGRDQRGKALALEGLFPHVKAWSSSRLLTMRFLRAAQAHASGAH